MSDDAVEEMFETMRYAVRLMQDSDPERAKKMAALTAAAEEQWEELGPLVRRQQEALHIAQEESEEYDPQSLKWDEAIELNTDCDISLEQLDNVLKHFIALLRQQVN